jgi:hypothetical protein
MLLVDLLLLGAVLAEPLENLNFHYPVLEFSGCDRQLVSFVSSLDRLVVTLRTVESSLSESKCEV